MPNNKAFSTIAAVISAAGMVVAILIFTLSSCGCATTPKLPAHTEAGGLGLTIWKIPVVGLGSWGGVGAGWWGVAPIIVHQYNYQARPPALVPGTPPTPPTPGDTLPSPPPVDYQTIYGSAWDDPTLVVFKNDSYRKARIEIDDQRPIVLEPYGATANLHLGLGEHKVRLVLEKPTQAHGTLEVVRFLTVWVRPEDRSQIFYIYEW